MTLLVSLKDKVANDLNEPDIANAFRQVEIWANPIPMFTGVRPTGGHPTIGKHAIGEIYIDTKYGLLWLCTVTGTPGTWVSIGSGHLQSRVNRNTAWTTQSASLALFGFNNIVSDPFNIFNTGTNQWTVPIDGSYAVTAVIRYTPTAAGQWAQLAVAHNGASEQVGDLVWTDGVTAGTASISHTVRAAANDTISIFHQESTAALTGSTNVTVTWAELTMIGSL